MAVDTTMNRSRRALAAPSRRRGSFVQGGWRRAWRCCSAPAGWLLGRLPPGCAPVDGRRPVFIRPPRAWTRTSPAPSIDIDEQRTTPVPASLRPRGRGSPERMARQSSAFYFPPAAQYKGRFILGPTHQHHQREWHAGHIAFAFASGAYSWRRTWAESRTPLPVADRGCGHLDPRLPGQHGGGEVLARRGAPQVYGQHRPYGYIYGGSGGSYRRSAALQQTSGIWDGGVPFIMGNRMATPYSYSVRIHALRLLRDTGQQVPRDDGRDRSRWQRRPVRHAERGASPGAPRSDAIRVPAARLVGLREDDPGGPAAHRRLSADPGSDLRRRLLELPGYSGFDDPFGTLAAARVQDPPGARTVIAGTPSRSLLDSVPTGDLADGADLIATPARPRPSGLDGAVHGNAVPFGVRRESRLRERLRRRQGAHRQFARIWPSRTTTATRFRSTGHVCVEPVAGRERRPDLPAARRPHRAERRIRGAGCVQNGRSTARWSSSRT